MSPLTIGEGPRIGAIESAPRRNRPQTAACPSHRRLKAHIVASKRTALPQSARHCLDSDLRRVEVARATSTLLRSVLPRIAWTPSGLGRTAVLPRIARTPSGSGRTAVLPRIAQTPSSSGHTTALPASHRHRHIGGHGGTAFQATQALPHPDARQRPGRSGVASVRRTPQTGRTPGRATAPQGGCASVLPSGRQCRGGASCATAETRSRLRRGASRRCGHARAAKSER